MHLHSQARHRKPGLTGFFLATAFSIAALLAAWLSAGVTSTAPAHTVSVVRPADTGYSFLSLLRQDQAAIHDIAARPAVQARPAALARYTVRSGDTLSAVARRLCGTSRDWTGIYAASRAAGLTAWNANDLAAGQQLAVNCRSVPSMLDRAPLPPPPPPPAPAPVTYAAVTSYHTASSVGSSAGTSNSGGTYQGSGAMQQCIIARESGGNSQVMNATGHYGLYQFSASTWAAHGGNPADFGNASVAEQNQVYYNTVAADGYSDWAPYDGC